MHLLAQQTAFGTPAHKYDTHGFMSSDGIQAYANKLQQTIQEATLAEKNSQLNHRPLKRKKSGKRLTSLRQNTHSSERSNRAKSRQSKLRQETTESQRQLQTQTFGDGRSTNPKTQAKLSHKPAYEQGYLEHRQELSKLDNLIKEYQNENQNCAKNIDLLQERLEQTQRRLLVYGQEQMSYEYLSAGLRTPDQQQTRNHAGLQRIASSATKLNYPLHQNDQSLRTTSRGQSSGQIYQPPANHYYPDKVRTTSCKYLPPQNQTKASKEKKQTLKSLHPYQRVQEQMQSSLKTYEDFSSFQNSIYEESLFEDQTMPQITQGRIESDHSTHEQEPSLQFSQPLWLSKDTRCSQRKFSALSECCESEGEAQSFKSQPVSSQAPHINERQAMSNLERPREARGVKNLLSELSNIKDIAQTVVSTKKMIYKWAWKQAKNDSGLRSEVGRKLLHQQLKDTPQRLLMQTEGFETGMRNEEQLGWIKNGHRGLDTAELDAALEVYASSVYEPDDIQTLAKSLKLEISKEVDKILDKPSPDRTRQVIGFANRSATIHQETRKSLKQNSQTSYPAFRHFRGDLKAEDVLSSSRANALAYQRQKYFFSSKKIKKPDRQIKIGKVHGLKKGLTKGIVDIESYVDESPNAEANAFWVCDPPFSNHRQYEKKIEAFSDSLQDSQTWTFVGCKAGQTYSTDQQVQQASFLTPSSVSRPRQQTGQRAQITLTGQPFSLFSPTIDRSSD